MVTKFLLFPEKKRILAPPFAWIDRRFFFAGFMAQLSGAENLLYFFLILVADKDGLSYYSYDKICQLLKITADEFLRARDNLVNKNLIAHRQGIFQVLTLPITPKVRHGRTTGRVADDMVEPRLPASAGARSLKETLENFR